VSSNIKNNNFACLIALHILSGHTSRTQHKRPFCIILEVLLKTVEFKKWALRDPPNFSSDYNNPPKNARIPRLRDSVYDHGGGGPSNFPQNLKKR
jgi:hypothetical protein